MPPPTSGPLPGPPSGAPHSAPLATRTVEYRVFEARGENCGILVTDPGTGACAFRFRKDWDEFASGEADVLQAIAADLPLKLNELGPDAFLRWVDETFSNEFRVSPPAVALCVDLERTAQALYRRHVRSTVRRYQTHLPLVPIDLAAGKLGEDRARGAEEWIEAEVPGRRGLDEDFFIVRIHGRSMEPAIPDGSLCVFRSYYGGSRKGGIFIVQRIATMDEGGEFTIKRYDSVKEATQEGWRHSGIRMQPENPVYQSWDLDESERYITIAEFVSVLEDPLPA